MRERRRNKQREITTKNVEKSRHKRNIDKRHTRRKPQRINADELVMWTDRETESKDKQTAVSICVLGMSAFRPRS
jgi:hypothetical protein